jgi:hypothetical protein
VRSCTDWPSYSFIVTGWKIKGGVHQPPRFVIIAAPHTSNWDAFIMLTAAYIFRLKISWFVKEAAFFFPLGILVRAVGGFRLIAASGGMSSDKPSTRSRERKHGSRRAAGSDPQTFHVVEDRLLPHRARAGVPIVLGYIDYARKVAGLGPHLCRRVTSSPISKCSKSSTRR